MKYDLSLPPQDYYRIVEATREMIASAPNMSEAERNSIQTDGHGHIGDGNLHLNVTMEGFDDKDLQKRLYDLIDPFIMKFVRDVRGSVSAEHGVGR